MRRASDAPSERRRDAAWSRRALVGLWVLGFVVAAGVLATRWDGLIKRLARPAAAVPVSGGAFR
jgi:hypothetical protein